MSLADLLNQGTVIYPSTADEYMRKINADRNLKALAPDMARLLIDMAEELRKHSSENPHDYVSHPRADALLARFAALNEKVRAK